MSEPRDDHEVSAWMDADDAPTSNDHVITATASTEQMQSVDVDEPSEDDSSAVAHADTVADEDSSEEPEERVTLRRKRVFVAFGVVAAFGLILNFKIETGFSVSLLDLLWLLPLIVVAVLVLAWPHTEDVVDTTFGIGSNGESTARFEWWEKAEIGRVRIRWRRITRTLTLIDRPDTIDKKMLQRSRFKPNEHETIIGFARRMHWASRLVLRVGTWAVILTLAVGLGILLQLTILQWIGWMLAWIVAALIFDFFVNMHWYFRERFATNRRLVERFDPPFNLPGFENPVELAKLQGMNTVDTIIGKHLGYGTIIDETAASESDRWIREGLTFVPDYKKLKEVVDKLKPQQAYETF